MKLFAGGLLRTAIFAFAMVLAAYFIFSALPAAANPVAQAALGQVLSVAVLFSPPLYLILDLLLFSMVRTTLLRFLAAPLGMSLLFGTVCALSALTVA